MIQIRALRWCRKKSSKKLYKLQKISIVSKTSCKKDKNYRKFRWCRTHPSLKKMKIIENFYGVLKNHLKSVENYTKGKVIQEF